jgi:hypothetical protein
MGAGPLKRTEPNGAGLADATIHRSGESDGGLTLERRLEDSRPKFG